MGVADTDVTVSPASKETQCNIKQANMYLENCHLHCTSKATGNADTPLMAVYRRPLRVQVLGLSLSWLSYVVSSRPEVSMYFIGVLIPNVLMCVSGQ